MPVNSQRYLKSTSNDTLLNVSENCYTKNMTYEVLYHHYVPEQSLNGSLFLVLLFIMGVVALVLFTQKIKKKNLLQNFAWGYAALFFTTTSLTYIPGLSDNMGTVMGIFKLDLIDDLLHFATAIWATFAAWNSVRQSTIFFKIFGSLYTLDALIGLFTQRGVLDFGLWVYPYPNLSLMTNFLANLPHLVIGSFALFAGFFLSRHYPKK